MQEYYVISNGPETNGNFWGSHFSEIAENIIMDKEPNFECTCSMCGETVWWQSVFSHNCFDNFPNCFKDRNDIVYPQQDDRSIFWRNGNNEVLRGPEMKENFTVSGCRHPSTDDHVGSQMGAESYQENFPENQDGISTIEDESELNDADLRSDNAEMLNSGAKNSTDNDDLVDEELIDAVHARRILWDHTIPLAERGSPQAIMDEWRAVSQTLKDRYSPEKAKTRWKNLRDYFFRIVTSHRKKFSQSGAPGGTKLPGWKFYERMSFLKDVGVNTRTTSNVRAQNADCEDDDTTEDPTKLPRKRKTRKVDPSTINAEKIAEAIRSSIRSPAQVISPTLPTQPIGADSDVVDNFLRVMASLLRSLDKETLEMAMFQIHEVLMRLKYNVTNRTHN